jgi:hypothetical protein
MSRSLVENWKPGTRLLRNDLPGTPTLYKDERPTDYSSSNPRSESSPSIDS